MSDHQLPTQKQGSRFKKISVNNDYEFGQKKNISSETRLQSAKLQRRRNEIRERAGSIKAWNDDLLKKAGQIEIKPKNANNTRNIKYKHQTQILDKIDKKYEKELQKRQREAEQSDITMFDDMINQKMVNNQVNKHRRLMSANTGTRSQALIPSKKAQVPIHFVLNEFENLNNQQRFDERYKIPGRSKLSRQAQLSRYASVTNEKQYQTKVKLSKIYSKKFHDSIQQSSIMQNSLQSRKQQKAKKQHIGMLQTSFSHKQSPERENEQFDLIHNFKQLSTATQKQNGFLLQQNFTPKQKYQMMTQKYPINHLQQPRNDVASQPPQEIISPPQLTEIQSQNMNAMPAYESQVEMSQGKPRLTRQKDDAQHQKFEKQTGGNESTLDSEDLQMLMMIKSKLKRAKKKDTTHQKTASMKSYLQDFKLDNDLPQPLPPLQDLEQIDNEIERLKKVKKLHLAQRSSSITGDLKNDDLAKMKKIPVSRAQTSLQVMNDDSPHKQSESMEKSLLIQPNNLFNSEEIDKEKLLVKNKQKEEVIYLANTAQLEYQQAQIQHAKKLQKNQTVQTNAVENNKNQEIFEPSQEEILQKQIILKNQEMFEQSLIEARQQQSLLEQQTHMQYKQNLNMQQELIKQIIQQEVSTLVNEQKNQQQQQQQDIQQAIISTKKALLNVQSIDMNEISVKGEIRKQEINEIDECYQIQEDSDNYHRIGTQQANYNQVIYENAPQQVVAASYPESQQASQESSNTQIDNGVEESMQQPSSGGDQWTNQRPQSSKQSGSQQYQSSFRSHESPEDEEVYSQQSPIEFQYHNTEEPFSRGANDFYSSDAESEADAPISYESEEDNLSFLSVKISQPVPIEHKQMQTTFQSLITSIQHQKPQAFEKSEFRAIENIFSDSQIEIPNPLVLDGLDKGKNSQFGHSLQNNYSNLLYEFENCCKQNIEEYNNIELTQDKAYRKMLNDIFRQAQRIHDNKRLKPLQQLDVDKQLIELNEINMKEIQDPRQEMRNVEIVKWDDPDREEKTIAQKLKDIVFFKLNQHCKMASSEMHFMSRESYFLLEQQLLLPKLTKSLKKQVKKFQQSIVNNQLLMKLEQRSRTESTILLDKYFVHIKNYNQINAASTNLRMFDIVSKVTQFEGMYNQIDWDVVQNAVERVDANIIREQSANFKHQLQQQDINTLMKCHIIIPNDQKFDDIKVEVPNSVSETLQAVLIDLPIALEIQTKLKLNFCSKRYFRHINRYDFNMRFFHDVGHINFYELDSKLHYRRPEAPLVTERLLEPVSYNTTQVAMIMHNKHFGQVSNFIFQKYTTSVYTSLKNQEWDIEVKMLIQHLDKKYKKKQQKNDLIRTEEKSFALKPRYNVRTRSSSCPSIAGELERINHSKVGYLMLEMMGAVDSRSEEAPSNDEAVKMVRPLRRYGALTKYTVKQNEAFIIKKIQPMRDRIQDNQFLVYKNLEKWNQDWFSENEQKGQLSKHFGYKCQFIRDPAVPFFFMEVYQPILITKGEQKLHRQTHLVKSYKYRVASSLRRIFTLKNCGDEVFDKLTIKNKEPLNKKVIDAMKAQDLETDEDMKDIKLEDLASEEEGEVMDDEDNMKRTPGYVQYMECLAKVKHPLTLYTHPAYKQHSKQNTETTPRRNSVYGRQSKPEQAEKDIQILDLNQLNELNQWYDAYRSKKDKYKVNSILDENNEQIQKDFILQINQERERNQYLTKVKNELQDKDNADQHNVIQSILDAQYSRTNSLITKLKYNFGLGGKAYFSTSGEENNMPISATDVNKEAAEIEAIYDLQEEDQLVVEREIMMSLLGKFISCADQDSQSEDEDNMDVRTKNIQNSNLDEGDEKHHRVVTIKSDNSLLSAPVATSHQSFRISKPTYGNQDETISPTAHQMSKLQSFLTNNNFFDDIPLIDTAINEDSDLELKDEHTPDESKEMKEKEKYKKQKQRQRSKGPINSKDKASQSKRDYLQKLLLENKTNKEEKRLHNKSSSHSSDRFNSQNEVMINKMNEILGIGAKKQKMPSEEETVLAQKKIMKLLNDSIRSAIGENLVVKKLMFKGVNESNVEVVKQIIKKNHNINLKMRDHDGNSLVAIATCKGDLEMLKLLISKNFDINLPNHEGNAPLHFGIALKQLKCIEQLLFGNVVEELKNNKGLTPWELA